MLISAPSHCHCFPWALSPVLGLMNVSSTSFCLFPGLHRKVFNFFYIVHGRSRACQLTPWLISMLLGTASEPVNILLAAHPDMHIGKSLSLPGNGEPRNYSGHSQKNTQSKLTLGCYKQCARVNALRMDCMLTHAARGKCHFLGISKTNHSRRMSMAGLIIWWNHSKGICLSRLEGVPVFYKWYGGV